MSQMKPYYDLLENIFANGKDVLNKRTGAICKTVVGVQMTFDMTKGFPAITSRKFPFKSVTGELLGFFRGCTSAAEFRDLGCKFWDMNANETKAWIEGFYRLGEDDCGAIYGKQWTDWETVRVAKTTEEAIHLFKTGWTLIGSTVGTCEEGAGLAIYRRNINQLEGLVRKIMTDPSDRRIIVSGWNVGEFDKMSLPPCHVLYNFIPMEEDKTMSVVMTIRSLDTFLGTPSNIASTSLFLEIVCRLTGYTPDKVIIQGANAHLYDNSFEAARIMLSRTSFQSPTLVLSDNIKKCETLDDVEGCFARINPEDVSLEGYRSHPPLTVAMVS